MKILGTWVRGCCGAGCADCPFRPPLTIQKGSEL